MATEDDRRVWVEANLRDSVHKQDDDSIHKEDDVSALL